MIFLTLFIMTPKRLNCVILFINIMTICRISTVFGQLGSIGKGDLDFNPEKSAIAVVDPPANNNNSIQYHLYTPEHPEEICYFEPDVSNVCSFNASYETKVLIHGYTVQLLPGNFYEQIKDTLLEYNKYNVIIVNWTKYDGEPYAEAVVLTHPVAMNIGKMLNFLVSNRGVNPLDVHIIGHSLGAHIAGVAGKQVPSLRRITGLDPAGPSFSKYVTYNRLTSTSANFVDVIHTSNYKTGVGLGLSDAIGSIDIYPNGGNKQPACKIGGQYRDADGVLTNLTTPGNLAFCYHDIALPYFMNSIHTCNYLSVECRNYRLYSEGRCNSAPNVTDRMGLYCMPIPGLPNESTFYLNTSANAPYCESV